MFKLFCIFLFVGISSASLKHSLVPPAPYITDLKGGPCHDNQTCLTQDDNAFCKVPSNSADGGTCHCKNGYVSSSDRSRCLQADVIVGGSCQENQQCSFWETSTAICLQGSQICDCVPGYIPSDDLSACLPVVSILGTVSCQEDGQCQLGKPGRHSECVKRNPSSSDDFKVCKCKSGAVNTAKDHKCYPVAAYPGDKCTIHAQCTVELMHSRCVDKQCECNKGYQPREINRKSTCVSEGS